MLTFQCLQGSSPQYLQELVARKIPLDKYNLRDTEDVFLLENMCVEQLKENVCSHIHPLKFGMHYHFASEKLIIYKLSSAN